MATKSKSRKATARPSRKELREIAARRRRNQNLYLIAGGVVLLVLVGLIIYANIRSTAPVGGEETVPTQGNSHVPQGSASPVEYNTTPPTSGPHYPGLAPWAIYNEPIRYEQVIHNMEDGGIVVYYQCEEACPELVQQLEEVIRPYIDTGRRVVMMPNDPTWTAAGTQPAHRDMEARIALTAWQRIDKFDEFDAERIRAFIERYEGIDRHRG